MFGIGGFGRGFGARRGGILGGGLRGALLTGAGMMAWRWWKNRQARSNPGPIEPTPRQGLDADDVSRSGGSF